MMHKALHPRDYKDTQYVPRKEGRGFTSIGDNVVTSIQELEDYIKKKIQRKTYYSDQKRQW